MSRPPKSSAFYPRTWSTACFESRLDQRGLYASLPISLPEWLKIRWHERDQNLPMLMRRMGWRSKNRRCSSIIDVPFWNYCSLTHSFRLLSLLKTDWSSQLVYLSICMHTITNLWTFELNRSSKLRDINEEKKHEEKFCAFSRYLISRTQILNLRSRNQIRGK